MLKIYHNNRCSKSRAALALLEERGGEFEIIEYLENSPTKEELKEIIAKLGIHPRDLLRKSEVEYKENNLANNDLDADKIIEIMVKFPKLIERPIIVSKTQAVIARPIDNLIEMLEDE